MYEIISVLKESQLFTSIDIIDLIDEEHVQLLRIKARVIDGSLLYVTELHTRDYQKYSYHWHEDDGVLITRWDNKPHWKNLKTFPHHKHVHDKVLSSHRVTINEIIDKIKERIKS